MNGRIAVKSGSRHDILWIFGSFESESKAIISSEFQFVQFFG